MPSYENGTYASNMSAGYVDPSDKGAKDIKQLMDAFYQENYAINASLWAQGSIDKRFKVGDQQLYNQFYGSNSQHVQKFVFPLIRSHINMRR